MLAVVLQSEGSCEMEFDGVYRIMVFTCTILQNWKCPECGKITLCLYAFFWVIPRRLNFICRRFGTLCLFFLHRRIGIRL